MALLGFMKSLPSEGLTLSNQEYGAELNRPGPEDIAEGASEHISGCRPRRDAITVGM